MEFWEECVFVMINIFVKRFLYFICINIFINDYKLAINFISSINNNSSVIVINQNGNYIVHI